MTPEPEQLDNSSLTGNADAAQAVAADPFLRALVRHAGDGISVKDLEGRYLLVSDGVAAFFGLAAAEMVGRRDVDLLPPAAAAREREMDLQVAATGAPMTYEDALELQGPGDPAGGTFLVSVTKFPYQADGGRLPLIVGVGRDVSVHKRLEAQLAEAERLAGVGSWTFDPATGKATWSENQYRLLGYAPGEVEPSLDALLARVRAEDVERLRHETWQAAHHQGTGATDYEVRLPDGTTRQLHAQGRAVYGADGRIVRMIGTIQDVTALRASQHAMARSHALLSALMDTSEEGMLVVDEHMAIISHNRRFRELFDVPEALIAAGEDPPVLAHVTAQAADPEAFRARVEALYAAPLASGHDEVRLRDGRVLERFTTPLVALGPVSYGRVWFFRDISRRVALEAALRAQNADLRELAELKTTFINSISHDLRTPLTAVIGYAEFLEDGMGGALSATQVGYVGEIVRNAKRLEGMVDDLLDVARMDAGIFELRRAERDVVELAEGVMAGFRLQAASAGVALALEAAARPALAAVDAARLERVFANLVGNALKFTPRGGDVHVRVLDAAARLRVEVRDTGPGIAAADLPKLFQRFAQVGDRSRGGTGLGLFIARTIVEAHGGTIGVESEPGVGSTFWFELPRAAG